MPFRSDYDPGYFVRINKYYSKDLSDCYEFDIDNPNNEKCGIKDQSWDIWLESVSNIRLPECGKRVLYDEDVYFDN